MARAGTAAGAVVLGMTLLAGADERGDGTGRAGDRQGWHGRRSARLAEYLGLDEQQRSAVQQLEEQHRAAMRPLWEEGRELRRKLREATEAEKPDAQAVGEATLALRAHRERVKADRAAFEQKLVALLTPEQKQKFEALKAARELGRSHRRGPGPGRGEGPRGEL